MAAACGLSQSAVNRIWQVFALQPHRTQVFQLSKDPLLIEKVRDVVGLYLCVPDRALVLCVDEKVQIQALDCIQPLLPLRPGQVGRLTHDYRRHGTTSLFAALDLATGRVPDECRRRHRSVEFRRFLATIDAAVPPTLDVHLILDNYSTHKTPVIRRGVHRSTRELEAAIKTYLATYNVQPLSKDVAKAHEMLRKLISEIRLIPIGLGEPRAYLEAGGGRKRERAAFAAARPCRYDW